MSLTKFLGIGSFFLSMVFLPIDGKSQDEKVHEITFKKSIPKKRFFTKEYIKYLDCLTYMGDQKERFIFNNVENKKWFLTMEEPFNDLLIYGRNFYLNGTNKDPLCISLDFFKNQNGMIETNYNVLGANKFGEKKELYTDLEKLKDKSIITKYGLKKSKKVYDK